MRKTTNTYGFTGDRVEAMLIKPERITNFRTASGRKTKFDGLLWISASTGRTAGRAEILEGGLFDH